MAVAESNDSSDWDDWAEQMTGGASSASASKHSSPRHSECAPDEEASEEKRDAAWVSGMLEAGSESLVKPETDPIWIHAARMAKGLSLACVTTQPQRDAVVAFAREHSPQADFMIGSLLHPQYEAYHWYALCSADGLVGAACVGTLPDGSTGKHISMFTVRPDLFAEIFLESLHESERQLQRDIPPSASPRAWDAIMFFVTPHPIMSALSPCLRSHGLQEMYNGQYTLYTLPAHVALPAISIGDEINGVRVCALTVDDADIVNDHWQHKSAASLGRIKVLLRARVGVGLRDASGALVCWAITYEYGSIGMLHTMDSHRRTGLARVVVAALGTHHRCVRPDVAPFCHISDSNMASRGLFTSMGFEAAGTADWVRVAPPS